MYTDEEEIVMFNFCDCPCLLSVLTFMFLHLKENLFQNAGSHVKRGDFVLA